VHVVARVGYIGLRDVAVGVGRVGKRVEDAAIRQRLPDDAPARIVLVGQINDLAGVSSSACCSI